MQSDEDLDPDLACPLDGADQIRVLATDVRLLIEHVYRPVSDWDPNSVETCCLDLDKVIAGDEGAGKKKR